MASTCLQGLNVIEMGHVISGPFAGCLLAEFGANVIKVESPGAGDNIRNMGRVKDMWFALEDRNKKCVTLNLKDPRGKEILTKMLETTDILIENFRPGVLAKLGFPWERLQEINPRLVLVSISGYGQNGPDRDKPGFNRNGIAMAGMLHATGDANGSPYLPGYAVCDYATGMFGALDAMFAIYHRDQCGYGRGQIVDVALYESIFRMCETSAMDYARDGIVKGRIGNRHPATAPSGCYHTKDDKYLVVAVGGDKVFRSFCECIGRPELADDPRFAKGTDRCVKNRDAIEEIAEAWFEGKTLDEAIDIFGDKVPYCHVYTIADIFRDPQYKARENLVKVPSDQFGELTMQNVVPKLSITPGEVEFAGPALGSWNEKVYMGSLGISEEEFATLKTDGVI